MYRCLFIYCVSTLSVSDILTVFTIEPHASTLCIWDIYTWSYVTSIAGSLLQTAGSFARSAWASTAQLRNAEEEGVIAGRCSP